MLPFQITRLWGLKNKTYGFALVDERGIRLVFRDAADIQAEPEEDAESLQIDWDNFVGMEPKRGFLSDSLTIEVRVVPGDSPDASDDNMIQLELQKRDRDRLDRFERDVDDYRTGRKKDDVDEVLDDVRDLLDRM